ncbi:MAG: CHAT domain-containing protein, partial [Candidatus Zixiibacteriota bacterium]
MTISKGINMPNTLDFHIELDGDKKYKVTLFKRGSSQPLAHSVFDYDLSFMTGFEIRQLDITDKDPHGRIERLKTFGRKMYDKLFTPDIEKVWKEYLDTGVFLVLCLRIAPEAEGLEVLPWETLNNGEEYISAGVNTGMCRLPLDVSIQEELPPLQAPLRMFALISSPLDLKENERLAIESEQELLLQAVNTPSGLGKLQVDFEDEAKLAIIESEFEGGYQLFHYSGHGIAPEDGGGLLLEDQAGKKKPVRISDFMQALRKGEKDLRLAVISGCQTAKTMHTGQFQDLARGLVRRNVPAVIAMQFSISDAAGLAFAEKLYPEITEGEALVSAVSQCRRILLHSDHPFIQADAFTPVLFMSHGSPLQITAEKSAEAIQVPKIDFSLASTLPQLSFGFYGRQREYRDIRDGILHKNHRAVIVHGIGGIGKTALASHAASRLKDQFKGVYAFNCSSGAIAPETVLLELHRYLERLGVTALQQLLYRSYAPEELGNFIAQILSQVPLLIIFDNFESQLTHEDGKHTISDENLGMFLATLVNTTTGGTRFLFTTRFLFDLDAKRLGPIQHVPLDDLSRPEALGLMQKLPSLSAASYSEKLQAFETFGGHPYALVILDRQCGHKTLAETLKDASAVHTELREFIAIELSYSNLSDRARELLNGLAAFRTPVTYDAVEWVLGERIELPSEVLDKLDRAKWPDSMKSMADSEMLGLLKKQLPEQRQAADTDRPVKELINWGLLT